MDKILVQELLDKNFTNISIVSEGVFRATKEFNQEVYQICYVDFSQKVLDDNFDIDAYQRSILMDDYYSNEGAIQWSFYLYFLLDQESLNNSAYPSIKYKIEEDRKLARKFILTISEFEKTNKSVLPHEDLEKPIDIIDHWKNHTPSELLDIFNEKMAVNGIADSYIAGIDKGKKAKNKQLNDVASFEQFGKFKFVNYRQYPLKKLFEFGKINLIHGPNAVGKTSLLEAIELAICGRTFRNPENIEQFEFITTSLDGKHENTIKRFTDKEYRSRDYYWYGKNYRQGDQLYKSFARFNFFDSDAAVRFSERLDEEGGADDALSSIVFGPDAESIFQRIQNLESHFARRVADLQANSSRLLVHKKRFDIELNEKSLADVETYSQEQIKKRFHILEVNFNNYSPVGLEDLTRVLGESSTTIASWKVVDDMFGITDFGSFKQIIEQLEKSISKIDKLEGQIKYFSNLEKQNIKLISELETRSRILDRLREYERSGAKNIQELEESYLSLTVKIQELDKVNRLFEQVDQKALKDVESITIKAATEKVKSEYSTLHQKEIENNTRLQNIKSQIHQAEVLIEQIRNIGESLTQEISNIEVCPLCETNLKPENLSYRLQIEQRSNVSPSKDLDELLKVNSNLTRTRVLLESKTVSIDYLQEIQLLLNEDEITKLSIDQVFVNLSKISNQLSGLKSDSEVIKQKISAYSKDGFSKAELNNIAKTLAFIIRPINQLSEIDASIKEYKEKVDHARSELSNSKELLKVNLDGLEEIRSTSKIFTTNISVNVADESLSKIRETLEAINNLNSYLIIKSSETSPSLNIRISEIKRLVSSYLTSIAEQKSLSEMTLNINVLAKLIDKNNLELNRARHANGVLKKLITEQNPKILLDKFMQQYAGMISTIFERIHSPKEFVSVKFNAGKLYAIRALDNSLVSLTKLSTGQRTAFVLAVFLAINPSLNRAPRILIFDDPVAYVDDLNVLLFIDYLQKLALEWDRQIFFVTANKRIASIFEKKFDFLRSQKNGFKSIPLSRLEYSEIEHFSS